MTSAVILVLLAAVGHAAEPAVAKSTAPPSAGSIDLTACFVAGTGEKNALKALRFMSNSTERNSAFRAEKFFQTKIEYSPKAGGCDVSVRVAASEDGVSAEAFSSRSGKLLLIERQEALTKESGAELYRAVAERLRKDPDLLGKTENPAPAAPLTESPKQ